MIFAAMQNERSKNKDAVEFLRDFRRMCLSYDNCTGCELRCAECIPTEKDCDHEKVIRVVEEWTKAHPVKTRLSELVKIFPNYKKDETYSGIPRDCIKIFDQGQSCTFSSCLDCQKKFWLTPIEEEEK